MQDSTSQFHDAIRATGLQPPDVIVPGKFHRFPGIGKGKANKAGWCKLFDDCMGGYFGDFSSDLYEGWQARRDRNMTATERTAFKHQIEEARSQAAAEREVKYAKAADIATSIWMSGKPAMFHDYLKRKQILPLGIRADLHNNLLIPLYDGKKIHSLQFIRPDGTKRFLKHGKTKGMFYPIKLEDQPAKLLICEGFATGATLFMDTKLPVLVSFYAGNLEPVAVAARKLWPDAEMIIAGDDDRQTIGNPGATKAREAAITSGALLALPPWPEDAPNHLTDFNDLACWLNRYLL